MAGYWTSGFDAIDGRTMSVDTCKSNVTLYIANKTSPDPMHSHFTIMPWRILPPQQKVMGFI